MVSTPRSLGADPRAQELLYAQIADKARVVEAHLDHAKAMAALVHDLHDRAALEVYISAAESMMARVRGRVGE